MTDRGDVDAAATEPLLGGLPTTLRSEPTPIEDPDSELVIYPAAERYRAKTVLGEGGMGEVRLCHDRVIGREVAVKVILGDKEGRGDLRQRFVREARVQGQLEHPAIVPVYDFGVDADDRAFFTMRRVRGETLERILAAQRRSDPAALRDHARHRLLTAFVRVCLAIEFAHERGVLHRDLKPANVMIGAHGEVYVLDWGLAKVRSAAGSSEVRPAIDADGAPASGRGISGVEGSPTQAGAVLGTPQYMAPEQIRGEELDARTDVYALGAILFELLTHEPLHGEGNVAAILSRAAKGVDARASVRAPERDVPPELEMICVRATSHDPADRYASARALGDAVEAYLAGDRDLELRKQLASDHLARAKTAAARALSPEASSLHRTEALREAGRAVTLAPDDPEALDVLMRLLTEPPRRVPADVLDAVELDARVSRRAMMPRVAALYAAVPLVLFPLEIVLGVRSWGLALAPTLLWWVSAASAWVAFKLDHSARGYFPYVTVLASIALAFTTVFHGPLIAIPAIAAVHAMGMALTTDPRNRLFATASYGAALVVPLVLAWLGRHPVAHTFVDGELRVSAGALALPQHGTFAYLGVVHVAILIAAARFGAAYRDTLTRAQTKSELLGWQLRQLVPAAASRALDPSLPGSK